MGCGTSLNDNDVKAPTEIIRSEGDIPLSVMDDNNPKVTINSKDIDLREIKTEKSIVQLDKNQNSRITVSAAKEEFVPEIKPVNARVYLFGESKEERKIVQFEALPSPHIEILLSRSNNPPPVKYQPPEVILEESQELNSSNLYESTSHPPYNYMFATFVKYNTIFLCGGVNFDFENISNEAFFYSITKEEPSNINTPQKSEKGSSIKKQRRIGNNLMGSKFERLGKMRTKRYSHMGVFYKAGKLGYVYVFGGRTENDDTLARCEKYSISENKWEEISPMNAPRSTGFSIIVNKKIYIFGGYTSEGKRSKKIEKYNPTFDSWETLNFKLHKGIETGLVLPCPSSNEVLIIGGNVEFGAIKTVIRLNFEHETYVWDSDLKKERLLQKGISLLEENTAYVLGGDFEDTVEKYSYKDKTWKIVSNLNYGECVSPEDINAFSIAQETIELIFDGETNAALSAVKDDKETNPSVGSFKYIFGSDDYPCIYELNTSKWVLKRKNVPMALRLRSHMVTTKIKEGKIFIAGGIDAYFEKSSRAAYIYYPGTNKAIEIAKMKEKKFGFSACFFNNSVYIFGGQTNKEGTVLSSVEKYDINEDKWIELPDMPRERTFSKAILSPNNKIYLFGGTDCLYQGVCQVDIFDPETDTFTSCDASFPLGCEIKFLEFTGEIETRKVQKPSQEFEFLDELTSSKLEGEEKDKKEGNGEQTNDVEEIKENVFLVFGYNSYRKEDDVYEMAISENPEDTINYAEKYHKVYPYSLIFTENYHSGQTDQAEVAEKLGCEEHWYYMISNKGFFKWSKIGKEVSSQIVINQMHLLQMPLEKFSVV